MTQLHTLILVYASNNKITCTDEINIYVDAGKKELKFSTMAEFVAWKNQEETSTRTS